MANKDYENFVARMGSFDMDSEEFLDLNHSGTNYIKITGNELYHYGVPGMKWGKRTQSFLKSAPVQSFGRKVAELNGTMPNSQRSAAKAAKKADKAEFKKQFNKAQLDQFRHPIISTKEQAKYVAKNKTIRINTTARAKELNDAVDKEVARVKAKKAAKIKAMKDKPVKKNDAEMEKKVDDFLSRLNSAGSRAQAEAMKRRKTEVFVEEMFKGW